MTRTYLALLVFSPVLILSLIVEGWAGLILSGVFASLVVAIYLDDRSRR